MKQLQRSIVFLLAAVLLLTGFCVGAGKATAAGTSTTGMIPDPTGHYRWETIGSNTFASSTTGGAVYNGLTLNAGSVSGGVQTGTQYTLEHPVKLNHDDPWVIQWKSSGTWSAGGMLLASSTSSYTANCPYLYRRKESTLIAFGVYSGGQFNNYGINLEDHGINGTAEHVYRIENRIAANGSNMAYLLVDGVELGAMNNYYIASYDQGTTSNWFSGRDFEFTYMGNATYPLSNCTLDYIQVWGTGETREPASYRWEAATSGMTSMTAPYTSNQANLQNGTCTNGSFDDAYFKLEKDVVLLHDQPWTIEWQSEGSWNDTANGALLLSASNIRNALGAPYLYRRHDSELIAFGQRLNGYHNNYGVCLSDHGIDGTQPHTYRLENRINTDGSNMVYLYVDGRELGPMNNYYQGGTNQATTSNWISGKDFAFSYMGTAQFMISNCSMDYLQISEGTLPTGIVEFRNWDGTVLSSAEYTYGEAVTIPSAPTRAMDETYTYTFTGWDKEVVPCSGDAVYTAVYSSQYRNYTVTFRDHDGTIISQNTYHYGDVVKIPADPTRVADEAYTYTFTGWDKTITACTGDAQYTATYDAVAIKHPVITPRYPTLSFEDEIVINVYFSTTDMEDIPLTDMGLITWSSANTTGTIENAGKVIPGAAVIGDLHMVRTSGIAAKNLGDTVYFKIYAKLSDGSYLYSNMYNYSPKQYATQQLAGSDNSVKPLIVAMLNYGAAAQEYFRYRPYNLLNKDLTAQQKALVKSYDPSMVAAVTSLNSSKVGAFASTGGFGRCYPTVSFEGAFSIGYYFTPSYAMDGDMTLYCWSLSDYNKASVLTAANATGTVTMEETATAGEYYGEYRGIAAKNFDETVFVAGVYQSNGVTYCTGVTRYSLGQYCKGLATGTSSTQPLAAATAVYGYYAKTYFSR